VIYRVSLQLSTVREGALEVEAGSPEHAREMATELAGLDMVAWTEVFSDLVATEEPCRK